MNKKIVGRVVGALLVLEAVFMLPAMLLCLADGDPAAALGFAGAVLIACLVGGALLLWARQGVGSFYAQEGFVATALSWIVISFVGALPFWLSGAIPHFVDALFEIVSGFTTTGASILPEVESLPRGILLWRSFSHWLGGMGMLVFLLAVVPIARRGTGANIHLMRAESPGPSVGKLTPKLQNTALILYGIYMLLTALDVVFLLAGGMPLFDSLCTAFGTAGTGGFGIKNDSIAGYSPYLQTVTTVFMFLFGVNFSLYFLLLLRRWKDFFFDEELRLYAGVTFGAIAVITFNIRGMFSSLGQALHHAAFQVSSIITTTGFSTVDFDQWPSLSKGVLLILMCLGACAGSTGGGLKMARVLLLLKGFRRSLRQTLNPRRVQLVRVNGHPVAEDVLAGTNAYLAAYCALVVLSFLVVSVDGLSITTNLSAVIACFNNIGPGFEGVGAARNFGHYSDLSKLVLTLDMLLGRLEIYPILALVSRHTWSRKL